MKTGIELIAEERQRQIDKEGWTPEHDDTHGAGEMSAAAGVYALMASGYHTQNPKELIANYWPPEWADWFKPKDRLSNLVRAGALIAAEIDRLNRKKETQ
jgi:hypothetical protein